MSTLSLLVLILFGLMVLVGGKRGLSAFLSVVFNFSLLFMALLLIAGSISPLLVVLFTSICILAITIFMGNSDEDATTTAFFATIIVLLVMMVLMLPMDYLAQIKGFANEQSEEIEAFNLLVGVDFEQVLIATTILSTLGAIAEAAVAIASGLEELSQHNAAITLDEIYRSGKNIGFQIMGMTFNTLFFGMFGGDLALFVLLHKLKENFGYYLNSKIFVAESMQVLYSVIAVVLVIAITTYLMGKKIMKQRQNGLSKSETGDQDEKTI